jgi:hypothetical protein
MNLADGKAGSRLLFVVRTDLFPRHKFDLLWRIRRCKALQKALQTAISTRSYLTQKPAVQ